MPSRSRSNDSTKICIYKESCMDSVLYSAIVSQNYEFVASSQIIANQCGCTFLLKKKKATNENSFIKFICQHQSSQVRS